jgi:hypothetical protein
MQQSTSEKINFIVQNTSKAEADISVTAELIQFKKSTKWDTYYIFPFLFALMIYLFAINRIVLGFDIILVGLYIAWSTITSYPNVWIAIPKKEIKIQTASLVRQKLPFFKEKIIKANDLSNCYIKRQSGGFILSRLFSNTSGFTVVIETADYKEYRLGTFKNKQTATSICELLMDIKS